MEDKLMRLSQVARELNVGISTIADYLGTKGIEIEAKPNTKIDGQQYNMLAEEFAASLKSKKEADKLSIGTDKSENRAKDVEKTAAITKPVQFDEPAEKIIAKAEKLKGLTIISEPQKLKEEDIFKTTPVVEQKVETPKVEDKAIEINSLTPVVEVSKPSIQEKTISPVEKQVVSIETTNKEEHSDAPKIPGLTVLGKVEIPEEFKRKKGRVEEKTIEKPIKVEAPKKEEVKPEPPTEVKLEVISAKADKLQGLTVLDKIELPVERKPKPIVNPDNAKKKRKRKRVGKDGKIIEPVKFDPKKSAPAIPFKGRKPGLVVDKKVAPVKDEISKKEIQEKLNQTLSKIAGASKGSVTGNRSKYRKDKRSQVARAEQDRVDQEDLQSQILKVTEFVSANELSSMMNVSVNEVISVCMSMGMFVSINQRLDAEAITVIADEFNYEVEFISAEEESKTVDNIVDSEEELIERPPIVTIMGHVDHGKTSLLDYIRTANVTDKEAGGITQHIGAYTVLTDSGKQVSFLDTPGHEAFTAMRARGAQLTDIVVVVIAADDAVMPQTKEALNHAQAAGVPIIIAINKIDREGSNPEKIKEQLANLNILVEDWGGKYQCQELSAKTGVGVEVLLEKILLEAEVLELKANPNRQALGTVVEASLDKGRGYVTTVLVQKGTLNIGDIVLAGSHYGKVKAMTDHAGKKMQKAGPSVPVQLLGLDGAPQAGDTFTVRATDREAREIASGRAQILREQSVRTKKHITLEEIGRRLAIGNFKELNLIIKGDVDGSVEALTDSLEKLSNEEVGVNVLSKGVGQISESDVLLASASDAIIIGFQVRPSVAAKKLAETEQIDIKLYSVIYSAIDEIKAAIEGMLEPDTEEVIVGNVEIREIFKIAKVTIAGCMVTDGTIVRKNRIRIIRDGIVTYEGELSTLKRFKDDVQEVKRGFECGVGIKGFNNLLIGDVVESYEIREVKKKLK